MRKSVALLISTILLWSCAKEKSDKNFVLTGNIKDLKKGTLYIQKNSDTTLVAIDTIHIDGNSAFKSEFNLDEPEMLYLFLDRGVTNSLDNNIAFFAEKGTMNIETSLDYFTADAKITGSKNHDLYEDYKKVTSRYVDQNLELIQQKIALMKENKTEELAKVDELQKSVIKKKYLYTTNFAVNHADYEIAPYVAMAEIYDINLKYLDTIQKSMSPKVSKSKYGKMLTEYYKQRKNSEQ